MRIDLHTHSTASDGFLSPDRLVRAAREHGVATLALTDHDTTEGVDEALTAGRRYGVEVIPGVEINTDVEGDEVHILGYFIDLADATFQALLRRLREDRVRRAEEMVRRLSALGAHVEWARVREIASGSAVGRPHLARALVEAGRVASPQEAFDRFIGRSGPAYVPRVTLAPEDAIEAIADAGGVPVLAHPGWSSGGALLQRLPQLVGRGLAGIEVYYPDHTPEMVETYREVASRYRLVATGGTDYHGGGARTGHAQLGSIPIPAGVVLALRARWASTRARDARTS